MVAFSRIALYGIYDAQRMLGLRRGSNANEGTGLFCICRVSVASRRCRPSEVDVAPTRMDGLHSDRNEKRGGGDRDGRRTNDERRIDNHGPGADLKR